MTGFARIWHRYVEKPSQVGGTPLPAGWLITALWVLLGVVMMSLLLLATLLLVRSGFFSTTILSDEQTKSLWAFLGVALGAAVTLVGALLTEQNNRRTSAITREAGEREQMAKEHQLALAQDTEQRLIIDTVAKVLELITIEGGYAPRARVAGAIATMMQLSGGTVAVRILGELWKADAVDSDTAAWLIDRILERSSDPSEVEISAAVELLSYNASKLLPAPGDSNQDWHIWPGTLYGKWPADLPWNARNAVLVASVRLLLYREISWWRTAGATFPISSLIAALDDEEFGGVAANVVCALIDSGAVDTLELDIADELKDRARELAADYDLTPWFQRLIDHIEPWAKGESLEEIGPAPTTLMAMATSAGSTGKAPLATPDGGPSPEPIESL